MLIEFWFADLNCSLRLHASIILLKSPVRSGRLNSTIREISQTLWESFGIVPSNRSYEWESVEMDTWLWIKKSRNNILLSILYTVMILLHRKRSFNLDLIEICINSYGLTHRRDSSERFALFVTRVSVEFCLYVESDLTHRIRLCERVNWRSIELPRLLSPTASCIITRLHQS